MSWSECICCLSLLPNLGDEAGLYRDDGLAVCKATPREIEKTKREVSKVFKSNGLKITIEANNKTINFLDVAFDLSSASYKPYMKPNNKLLYVHRLSNHPPALLKNIPGNINKRLTEISSNEQVFNEAIPHTNKRLRKVATTSNFNSFHKKSRPLERTKPGNERSPGTTLHGTAMSRPTWGGNFCSS